MQIWKADEKSKVWRMRSVGRYDCKNTPIALVNFLQMWRSKLPETTVRCYLVFSAREVSLLTRESERWFSRRLGQGRLSTAYEFIDHMTQNLRRESPGLYRTKYIGGKPQTNAVYAVRAGKARLAIEVRNKQ